MTESRSFEDKDSTKPDLKTPVFVACLVVFEDGVKLPAMDIVPLEDLNNAISEGWTATKPYYEPETN